MKAHTRPRGTFAKGTAARKIAHDTTQTAAARRRSRHPAGSVDRNLRPSLDAWSITSPPCVQTPGGARSPASRGVPDGSGPAATAYEIALALGCSPLLLP